MAETKLRKPYSVHRVNHVFIDLDSWKHPEIWLHVFERQLYYPDQKEEMKALVVEEGGFGSEHGKQYSVREMTRDEFIERYEIDCPEIFLCKEMTVETVETEKKSDDWQNPGDRKFGVMGKITNQSNAHGLCYEVEHEDGTSGWYDPWELKCVAR